MNHRMFKATDAHKLEDPERLAWLPPAEVLRAAGIAESLKVADIGAGTGYFAIPAAHAVGTQGHVYAVDVQTEMLDLLRKKLESHSTPLPISLHHGDACSTTLPNGCVDLVLLANVWHEFDDHACVFAEARRIATRGGRIAILDWSPEYAPPPGPPADHRIPSSNVVEFLTNQGCARTVSQRVGRYAYLVTAELPISSE